MPEQILRYSTEAALLQAVAAGNEQAFTQLFHQWQPFLATHIYRITESKELAEEIVQDVFLKIWQHRETLSAVQNFKAYLVVVSKNHALNVLKKISLELKNHKQWVKENTGTEHLPDPRVPYYSLLDEAVNSLSARQKQVYQLHRQQRLTYEQIARQLGISRESVKTHIGLAVKNITAYVQGRLELYIALVMLWM